MVLGLGKWLGERMLDPTHHINKLMDFGLQSGWKVARGLGRGIRGKRKMTGPDGQEITRGAFGDARQDFVNRIKQIGTGKEYDEFGKAIDHSDTATWMEKNVTSRIDGALHVVGDGLTAPLGVLGWGGKQLVKGTGTVAGSIAKKGVHLTGRATKEGIDFVGDAALGARDLVGAMNQTYSGRGALFGIGAVGATAFGLNSLAGKVSGSGSAGERGLQFYKGMAIDSVPGSVSPSSQMVDDAGQLVQKPASSGGNLMDQVNQGVNQGLDSLGADGDLVFAMHNMR